MLIWHYFVDLGVAPSIKNVVCFAHDPAKTVPARMNVTTVKAEVNCADCKHVMRLYKIGVK